MTQAAPAPVPVPVPDGCVQGRYGAVLVIVDGLSDVAPGSLNGCTPMQLARMPTLDRLTAMGRTGLMDPVRPGLACGSDTAHLAMFGYKSERVYRGRGAFETVGTGVPMHAGDVAFKCNFALLDDSGTIVKARCAGSTPDFVVYARLLCAALHNTVLPDFPDVVVTVKHAMAHRLVVCLSGPDLSDAVSNTDPQADGKPLLTSAPRAKSNTAVRTACVVNQVSRRFHEIIASHPDTLRRRKEGLAVADVVLLRGASEQIDIPSFLSMHGMRTFLIAPTKIIAGIGITCDMHIVEAPGATGDFHTNLLSKSETCVRNMCKSSKGEFVYDLGIVHVKAVDEAGHLRDVKAKVHWLEQVDIMVTHLIESFQRSARDNILFAITGDHTTIAELGEHTCEPVPIVFTDISPLISRNPHSVPSRTDADDATLFDEVNIGSNSSIGRFQGIHLMNIINKLIA